jgi:hypothetical protein
MATPLVHKPPRRPVTPGLPLFAVALSAALAGAALAYLLQPGSAALAAADAAALKPRVAATALSSKAAPAAPVDAPAAASWLQPPAAGVPLSSVAELQALRASLNPSSEFARVAEPLLFADATRLFAALAVQPGDGEELRAAAALLTELLQARAQRGELTFEVSDIMQSQVQALLHQVALSTR